MLIITGILLTFWWVISDPSDPKFLGSSDVWTQAGPYMHFLDHGLHHGEFPLWNPLFFCGQPYAAHPSSMAFYPPNLIRSLLTFDPTPMKTHIGINMLVFFHLLLGGATTFFLARQHGLSYGASMVAAFAFTFSAPSVTRAVGHWIFHNVVCWLPLTLMLLRQALTKSEFRYKVGFALVAGLVWGMSILGGFPGMMVVVAFAIGVYWLLFRTLHPTAGVTSPPQVDPSEGTRSERAAKRQRKHDKRKQKKPEAAGKWRPRLKLAARIAGGDAVVVALLFATGVLVAFPMLLPAQEFASFSERGESEEDEEENLAPIGFGWGLLRVLVIYQGDGHYEGGRAAGAGVFFLALVALVCRPRRVTLLFAFLFLILLDCSMAEPLLFGRLLKWAAPFKFSNAARGMMVACLPLGLLAGAGLDAALAPVASLRWRAARSCAIILLGVAVVLTLALAEPTIPRLDVGVAVVLLPVAICLAVLAAGWLQEPIVWGAVVSMLILGETLAWNKHLVPSVVPEEQRFPNPMSDLRTPKTFWDDNYRGTDLTPNVLMYGLKAVMNGYDPLHMRHMRDVLCTTKKHKTFRRMIYGSETTAMNYRGFLFLKRQFWLARQYVEGPLPGKRTLFPPTTTAFLDNPGDIPVPRVEREALPRASLSENTTEIMVKPRGVPALTVRSEDIEANAEGLLHTKPMTLPPLHSSLFLTLSSTCGVEIQPVFVEPNTQRTELGKTLTVVPTGDKARVFEVPMPDFNEVQILFKPDFKGKTGEFSFIEMLVRSDQEDEDKFINILSRTANRVEVEVGELPGNRILVFVDAFYPGWEARVDGEPAPIYRANDVFKAVVVPVGTHRVEFAFRSRRVSAGLAVSGATLLAIAGMAVLALRGRRRARAVQGESAV